MSSPSDFDVVVLGAGVVGINSAYWLARAGKSVCVIDRQCAAGLETSFANGGQISVSHAEPWANPSAPLKVLKWLMNGDSPLLFRPTLDVHQWLWLAQFMVDCLPGRADRHTTEIVKLATASRALLQEIRAREQLDYDQRTRGILHFYRDPREFESATRVAELMRTFGCDRRVISTARSGRARAGLRGVPERHRRRDLHRRRRKRRCAEIHARARRGLRAAWA